jgi:hypothetical protein
MKIALREQHKLIDKIFIVESSSSQTRDNVRTSH